MRFKKGQDIKTEGKEYTCICCDEEFACFARLKKGGGGGFNIDMTKLFVVSNMEDFEDGFKFKLITK